MDPDTRSEGEFLISVHDVTAAVVARRDIRRFHHAVSHKLNTPLNLVLGGLEFLSEEGSDLTGLQIGEMSSLALVGARRLQSAVDDVLRYLNQPWATAPAQGCFPKDLPALVSENCAQSGISQFSCTVAPDVSPRRLMLTSAAMSAILDEILENAQKFHPQHQPIVEVTIREPTPGMLSLVIGDDGIHLSPEQLVHAWDLYFQGEKWFTGEVPGMGLGLSLVASLVWGVGGHCNLLNRSDSPGILVELAVPFQREDSFKPN
ncbi:MAG: HAMP domain-containing histidine kinase [Anaerolineales bacterium]|nr:HAMP domain-containing histidine kinase [Anaerolineales bacterium]